MKVDDLKSFKKEELIKLCIMMAERLEQLSEDNTIFRQAINKACIENNIKYIRGLVR